MKAAIYARLSVDRDGTKVGIDAQLTDSRRLAADRGWEVVGEYVDRNLSAADRLIKRPEYDRLVTDYQAGKFGALVCWDLDRLTRQPRQLEDWIEAAEDSGLVVVTANGEADLSVDAGRLFARIKASVAKSEAERASARQRRNKQYRRENGLWHGGTVPYGYKRKDKTLAPNPKEVAVIHEAMSRVLAGDTMYGIVQDFNARGMTTRAGKGWRQSNLRPILLNRSNLGETKAGAAGWEPIVDRATFDRVTAILTDESRKSTHSPGVKGGKYSMGGGVAVCAECGHRLITHQKRGRAALACLKRVFPEVRDPKTGRVKVKGACGGVVVDHARLEAQVLGFLFDDLRRSKRLLERASEPREDDAKKVAEMESQRAALREQRERAVRAYIVGLVSEADSLAEAERIDAELDEIERRITATLSSAAVADVLSDPLGDWTERTQTWCRGLMNALGLRVKVGRWPEELPRNFYKRTNETLDDYHRRQGKLFDEAVRRRAVIVNTRTGSEYPLAEMWEAAPWDIKERRED